MHDTSGLYKEEDGSPFVYHPHCTWTYVLNDECVDEKTGETIFEWLAGAVKKESAAETRSKYTMVT